MGSQEIGGLHAALSADTAQFKADMGKARRIASSAARDMDKSLAGAADSVSKSAAAMSASFALGAAVIATQALMGALTGVASQVQSVAKAAKAAAQELAKVGGTFERDLALVGTLSDEARGNLDEFRKDIIQLSLDSGQSFEALNKALFDNISGLQDVGNAMHSMRAAADLAAAGNTDIAITMNALVRVLRGYGLEGDRANDVADRLFAAMQGGVVTVEELATNVGKVAAVAASAGVSLDEFFGVIARGTQLQNAEEALTGMRNIMIKYSGATEQVKKRSREMAQEMGVVGFEFSKAHATGVGLVQFMRELERVVDGDNARLAEMGIETRTLVAALSLMGKGADELEAQVRRMAESQGLAAENAAFMGKQTVNQLARMQQAVEGFKVELFRNLLEPWLGNLEDVEIKTEDLRAVSDLAAGVIRLGFSLVVGVVSELLDMLDPLIRGMTRAFKLAVQMNQSLPTGVLHAIPGFPSAEEAIEELDRIAAGSAFLAEKAREVRKELGGLGARGFAETFNALGEVRARWDEFIKRRDQNRLDREERERNGPKPRIAPPPPSDDPGPSEAPTAPPPVDLSEFRRVHERVREMEKQSLDALLDLDRDATEQQIAQIRERYAREIKEVERNEKLTYDQRAALVADLEAARFTEEIAQIEKRSREREKKERELAAKVKAAQVEIAADLAGLRQSETERQVAEYRARFADLVEEVRAAKGELQPLLEAIELGVAGIRADRAIQDAIEGDDFGAGLAGGLAQMRKDLESLGEVGAQVSTSFARDFSQAFGEFASGVRRSKAEYLQFAKQFIAQTIAMIAQQAILRAFLAATTGGTSEVATPAASAASGAGGLLRPPRFANGGTFKVGGAHGVDRNLVSFRASRGEVVRVQTPAQARKGAGGGMGDIHIHDHVGVAIQQRRSADRPDDVIIDIVARDIGRNGKVGQAVRTTFGAQRRGRGA